MTNFRETQQANFHSAILALNLDRNARKALHLQLTEMLRDLILSGNAVSGTRLPASRQLAKELSVSRATTQAAFDQLIAEGYLLSRRGDGTYVAEHLPHVAPPSPFRDSMPMPVGPTSIRPFQHSVPDLENFPYETWAKHLFAAWRQPHPDLLKSPDPFGWGPLRTAIARHLKTWRGIDCGAGQIAITSGVRETFDLIARLFSPDSTVQLENPCYGPIKERLESFGHDCHLSNVDEDGFDPSLLLDSASGVVVTPSRQFPIGMALPLHRRLALLDWATTQDGLLIEDDYDSEFRFTGSPLPSLTSLDTAQRTIYVGSFSKLFIPSLRLGYMVVPERLIGDLTAAIGPQGTQASLAPQPALATLMESGTFAVHVRRMRRLYAKRWKALLQCIEDHLSDWLIPRADPSGMHIYCYAGPKLSEFAEADVIAAANETGVILQPASSYYHGNSRRNEYVLGFAAFEVAELEASVLALKQALRCLPTTTSKEVRKECPEDP